MPRFLCFLWLVFCGLPVSAAQAQGDSPAPALAQQIVAAPPVAPLVWLNTHGKVYHFEGSRWYGTTQHGKYLSEAEAMALGGRAARNERRPGAPATPAASSALVASPAPVAEDLAPPLTPAQDADATSAERISTCITAIAAQSDPAKLATLSLRSRAANPRLKRILYYLAQARAAGANPGDVIEQAQQKNGSAGTPRAPLVKASLLRNLKICDGLGLLTESNLAGLRRGQAPTVTRGPYAFQKAEVDHIVPLARAPQVGNELANLEMLPAALNRAKSAKVGERQLALAKKFRDAGLISEAAMAAVQARFRPAGTAKYELPEE